MNLQSLRRFRVCDLVVFDTLLAVIGLVIVFTIAWKIHFSKLPYGNFVIASVLLVLPIAIFSHILVGTNTTLNYNLGLSYNPDT